MQRTHPFVEFMLTESSLIDKIRNKVYIFDNRKAFLLRHSIFIEQICITKARELKSLLKTKFELVLTQYEFLLTNNSKYFKIKIGSLLAIFLLLKFFNLKP